MPRPNLVFLLVDQLVAQVLNAYGARVIDTPHIDRLARRGVCFDNMISTCPVCTPFRSMWLTGRHPQSTGHVINFLNTRHDELGWGDVFAHAGYDTAYVGKWHLHRGSFPSIRDHDFVPEGRDRLGFRWWRAYNFHMDYFGGSIQTGDWYCAYWDGYETHALNRYAFSYLDEHREPGKPFCLLVNPHPPHITFGSFAPAEYYERLPPGLDLPPNSAGLDAERDRAAYRDYLAMVLAIDDMLGELLDGLEQRGLSQNTLFVLGSDHGMNLGAHGDGFWEKKMPWEENLKVPLILHWPGVFEGGQRRDTLTAPVDLLPTLASLCGIAAPASVEGLDLSASWRGESGATGQEDVLIMNFCDSYDHARDGNEWRGLRTPTHTFARFRDGRTMLFDNAADPHQQHNLLDQAPPSLAHDWDQRLEARMARLGDALLPGSSYRAWFDTQRRIIANSRGPLPHPESQPDWSLLR